MTPFQPQLESFEEHEACGLGRSQAPRLLLSTCDLLQAIIDDASASKVFLLLGRQTNFITGRRLLVTLSLAQVAWDKPFLWLCCPRQHLVSGFRSGRCAWLLVLGFWLFFQNLHVGLLAVTPGRRFEHLVLHQLLRGQSLRVIRG